MSRYGQRTLTGNNREISGLGRKPVVFSPLVASGGNTTTSISQYGINYNVHTFTSGGTFTVASLGDDAEVEYLIVAGGGGSGNAGSGAGGLLLGFFVPTAVAYTVTVGGAGSNSSISGTGLTTMTAATGGAGGGGYANGSSGGSGGGAGNGNAYNVPIGGNSNLTAPAANGGFGVAFGTAGGHCIDNDDYTSGGGARSSGQSRDRGLEPGGAGLPLAFNHATTSTTYATGGARGDNSPAAGAANTGNGGGGGGYAGGSGIIILRYRAS